MNIEDYEFRDTDISLSSKKNMEYSVSLKVRVADNAYTHMFLSKRDVIQLAKHFKLTVNDIEE